MSHLKTMALMQMTLIATKKPLKNNNMNLTTWDKTTITRAGVSPNTPMISINKKGQCFINKAARELTGLSDNDRVAVSQDQDNPVDWYLHKSPDGFILRINASGSMSFNSGDVREAVCSCFDFDSDETLKLEISEKPKVYSAKNFWKILFEFETE